MTDYDVLVAGEYYCDLIFTALPGPPRLGAETFASEFTVAPGGTYIMALAAGRLGLRTAWACDFGNDLFSRMVLEEARSAGLDDRLFRIHDRPLRRVSAAFSLGGERGFLSYRDGEIAAPSPGLFDEIRPSWLLQTFRYEDEWLAFVEAAKRTGARIFLDCRDGDFTLETSGVRELLAFADIFSPNEAEACQLAETEDPEEALAILTELMPSVVMKRGASGASAVSGRGRSDVPAPVVDVVDTTGAGDAFNAGFLYAAIAGEPLPACLRAAVLCGSLSTTGPGSRAIPTKQALEEALLRFEEGTRQKHRATA